MLPSRQLQFKLIQLSLNLLICFGSTEADSVESSSINKDKTEVDEEFAHLLNRASRSKRVHLISELTRNGHHLQLEEFLDLESWSQLLQFKWHEDEKLEDGEIRTLNTKKINIIILNDATKKTIVQYEPYNCFTRVIESNSTMVEGGFIQDTNWWTFVADSMSMNADDIRIKPRQRHIQTIHSIISTATNSPYFARVPINSDSDSDYKEAWAFGVVGLWLKAQFPGFNNSTPGRITHLENGVKIKDSEAWKLSLEQAKVNIMYYFDTEFIGYNDNNKLRSSKSNAEYDDLRLLEIWNSKSLQSIDMINVIDVDTNVSNQLSQDLFKFPIGYDCPANPNLSMSGMYFEKSWFSGLINTQATLLELESVATRYDHSNSADSSIYSSTDVKSLSMASCRHPMNSAASLTLFQIPENRYKLIRDYHSRVSYEIYSNGTKNQCQISGLHILDFNHRQATEPVEVRYHNGIVMNLNSVFLDYLFDSKGSPGQEQRPLNRIQVSPNKEELVFESKVTDSYTELLQVLDRQSGKPLPRRLSLVRVYERPLSPPNSLYKMRRRRALRLVRIILIVFDYRHQKKLAEIRLNLIKTVSPLSFVRRAQLFDVSRCHSEDTMELVVSYPAESRLIEYAESRSHEVVDEFYLSSLLYWGLIDDDKSSNASLEKQRLGMSLNFFRVPKVELMSSPKGDELKLRMLVLDKLSPIYLFDQIVESTFVTDSIDERLIVSNEIECAHFCRLHNCRLFAFDKSSLECKLSPISVEDQLEDDVEEGDDETLITVVRKVTSKIYYAPARQDNIDSQTPFEEASLAELYSYLEHSVGQLSVELDDEVVDDYDESEDSFVMKTSRQTEGDVDKDSLSERPLLSFKFTDKSDPKRKYAPPERILLIPREIKVMQAPISLDLSLESQKIMVAEAFRVKVIDKNFQLNLLDDFNWTPQSILDSDERTFTDSYDKIYYSFRRLHQLDIETCTEMCYNINTWDSRFKSEQICQSFSYCQAHKECTLVVKTDANFTQSIVDLVQEGDRVLEIISTDQLLVDGPGCVINSRNYLSNFDGPIKLTTSESGFEKTNVQAQVYEWLSVLKMNSGEVYDDSQDNCAKECYQRNRLGQKCLALDFCITKVPSDFRDHRPITKFETNCDLLILSKDLLEGQTKIINKLREQLIRPTGVVYNISTNGNESNCNRYLASHLLEFNPIRMRQVSRELISQLDKPSPTMNDLNLDNCALECSIRSTECLAFEYCNKYDSVTRVLQKSCSLIGRPKADFKRNDEQESATVEQVSTYSRDCHIYLRNEFKSLGDLMELKPSEQSKAIFQHREIEAIIYCTIFYLISLVVVILYWRSTNRTHQRFR